jgi:hypothetical protein
MALCPPCGKSIEMIRFRLRERRASWYWGPGSPGLLTLSPTAGRCFHISTRDQAVEGGEVAPCDEKGLLPSPGL